MQVDLKSKVTREVVRLQQDNYQAKLMPLSADRILVIGGQSVPGRNSGENMVKRTVTEVRWDSSLDMWQRGIQHDFMKRMRVNFGATLLRDGRVVVCGGNSICYQLTEECEIFDGTAWSKLP